MGEAPGGHDRGRAIDDGALFEHPETLEQMAADPGSGYGLGLYVTPIGDELTALAHDGFWGSVLVVIPELDFVLAATTNQFADEAGREGFISAVLELGLSAALWLVADFASILPHFFRTSVALNLPSLGAVIWYGATFLFVLGLLDYFFHIKPQTKLVGQILAASLVAFLGFRLHWFTSLTVDTMVTMAWIVGIIWGLDLGSKFVKRIVEPELRQRWIEREVKRELHHEVHAHPAKQFHGRGDIMQTGDIANDDRRIRQQGRGHDRQHGILGPGDADISLERGTAVDDQFIHRGSFRAWYRLLYLPAACPFFGCMGMQGKGMNLTAHAITQCAVNQLMLFDHGAVLELTADDSSLEMVTVSLDENLRIRDAGLDEYFDFCT